MSYIQGKPKSVYKKRADVVSRDIAGETILVPIRGQLADMQRIFALNPVAQYIWEHLNGEQTLEEIRSGLIESFEIEEERAERDLHEFIDELLEADLIVGVE